MTDLYDTSPVEEMTKEDSDRPLSDRKMVTWGCFIVAFLILVNPMPMLLDFIPDLFAYLLILFALRHTTGDLSIFADLKQVTGKLLILSAVKLPAFFLMMTIWAGDSRQRAIVAAFALTFAILEFAFLRSWTHELFDATARYGQKYNCDAALAASGRVFRMVPEKLERLTLIFFLVRSLLSCLPELILVPMQRPDATAAFNWNSLYPIFAIAGAVGTILFGIVWCCFIINHFFQISRDREANIRLSTDIAVDPLLSKRRDFFLINTSTVLFVIGIVLQFDLIFDNQNYLPDYLSAFFFLLAGCFLSTLLKRHRALWIVALTWGIFSVLQTIFYNRFYEDYNGDMLAEKVPEALTAHTLLTLFSALSCATLIAMCVLFCLAWRDVVARYTGIATGGMSETRMTSQMRGCDTEQAADIRKAYQAIGNATKRELNIKLIVATVIGCVSGVFAFLVDFLPRFTPLETPEQRGPDPLTSFIYGWSNIIAWVITILWLALFIHIVARLRREAELNLIDN